LNQRDLDQASRAFRALDRRAQVGVILAILVVAGLLLLIHYSRQREQRTAQSQPAPTTTTEREALPASDSLAATVDLLLGNPSSATTDPDNRANYLMLKPYYALSYNEPKGIPNWVSWRLTQLDLGSAPRKQLFDPDITLPRGFYRVTHKDYSGSGFDRGHMCPHSDRAAGEAMSFATFIMTNIIPQAPNVNQKVWADLEDYCRSIVRREHTRLYIISGPAGQGGRGSAGPKQTLAGGKVTVPAECWKVIVIVPETGGGDDLAKITAQTRVITVRMPNDNESIGHVWTQYRTTPAEIESRTGFKFFDRVPAPIADQLRQKLDTARLLGSTAAADLN
jgi:endonuclease G